MKKLVITLVAAAALLGAAPAQAHLPYKPAGDTLKHRLKAQERNLAHALYVCNNGANKHKKWACKAAVRPGWLKKERDETKQALAPKVPTGDIKSYMRVNHPCLYIIVAGEPGLTAENRAFDPTLDYGGGHGNVHEPYGIPQANPGTKMASAGPDWKTNPWTQLKWMIGYAVSRYGSECAALAFKRANDWY